MNMTKRILKIVVTIALIISVSTGLISISMAAGLEYESQEPKACKATSVSNALRIITGDNSFLASELIIDTYKLDKSKIDPAIKNHGYEKVVKLDTYCIDNDIQCQDASKLKEIIDKQLSLGNPIVVQVNGNPWHWVTIFFKNPDGSYKYVDPAGAKVKDWPADTSFGALDKWFGYVSFTVTKPKPTVNGSLGTPPQGGMCLRTGENWEPFSLTTTTVLSGTRIIRLGPYDTCKKVVTPTEGTIVTITSKLLNNKGKLWYSVSFEYNGTNYQNCWVFSGNIKQK